MYNIFSLGLGIIGFIIYLVYDINSYTIKNRLLSGGFFIGSLFIAVATIVALWQSKKLDGFSGVLDIFLFMMSVLSFICMVYSLFFALPFKDTYVSPTGCRKVCDSGLYGLCRHPGVIGFSAFYMFLGLAALPTSFWKIGLVFSVLNLLYAWFQDKVTFRKTFYDYADYCERVPFIIPNLHNVKDLSKIRKIKAEKGGKK